MFYTKKKTDLMLENRNSQSVCRNTYNGPGNMLPRLINEYGIMTMGFVGNAKYGCGGDIIGGLLADSGGL